MPGASDLRLGLHGKACMPLLETPISPDAESVALTVSRARVESDLKVLECESEPMR